jgi:endonuclease YncB( thermonuclease family)
LYKNILLQKCFILADLPVVMMLIRLTAFVLLLPPLAAAAFTAAFTATVVAVHDGDTLTVLHQQQAVRVRLGGVDAPEINQPFGPEARAFTADLALGRTVTVVVEGTDRYDRVVASVVLAGGRALSHEVVAAGLAWWSREFAPTDSALETLESSARRQRRGLWAGEEPTPPWQWRKQEHRPAGRGQRRSEPRSQRRDQGRSSR